jgi:hypothetical protein
MPSRICPRHQASVIGLTCLCLVSPHSDAPAHEEYGPVQMVPFIPDLAYTAASFRPPLNFPPTWRKRSSFRPPLNFPPTWRKRSSLRPPLNFLPSQHGDVDHLPGV